MGGRGRVSCSRNIANVIAMKSYRKAHSVRMWTNCRQYKATGRRPDIEHLLVACRFVRYSRSPNYGGAFGAIAAVNE